MNSLQTILALMGTQAAMAMSPGPNAVLVMHNASHDRRLGFITACGIWPAGFFWVSIGLCGLGSLLLMHPELKMGMYLICGLYLVWLGIKSIRISFLHKDSAKNNFSKHVTAWNAFQGGIISNITNPKGIAYWMSIFTATNAYSMAVPYQVLAAIMMPSISFIWYCTLTFLISHKATQRFLENQKHWFDRTAGAVMIAFGIKLLSMLVA
jgi:threonine efflux protein